MEKILNKKSFKANEMILYNIILPNKLGVQMFQLTEDVRSWLSGGAEGRERVVALHCKVQSRAPLLSNILLCFTREARGGQAP